MQIRTDLAMESRHLAENIQGVNCKTIRHGAIEETHVIIESDEAAEALSKAKGTYITLSCEGMWQADVAERSALMHALSSVLKGLLPPFGDILIIGLGNRHITADALGSRVLEGILVTRHMKNVISDSIQGRLRGVCAVAPGVLGITGIETAEMVKGVVEHTRPAALIAIDALAAREANRICTTIQVTDTGILPGSGVGNHRLGITRETMGIPVIAIGVPMVVYASVIARDGLSMLLDDMGMDQEAHEPAIEALVKKISARELGDMVVTPREVDVLVGKVAAIIADGLNMALQPRLSEEEISLLTHDSM